MQRGVHEDIIRFASLFIKRMRGAGIPMFASEMMRDRKRQDELFAQGRSSAPAGMSPHQYGLAVDIIHSKKGWKLTKREWEIYGHIGDEVAQMAGLKIESGKTWTKPWDPAHWQIIDWREIAYNPKKPLTE